MKLFFRLHDQSKITRLVADCFKITDCYFELAQVSNKNLVNSAVWYFGIFYVNCFVSHSSLVNVYDSKEHTSGHAWCPNSTVMKGMNEWIEVEFPTLVISGIIFTAGRGDGNVSLETFFFIYFSMTCRMVTYFFESKSQLASTSHAR